ncbi:MAG: prohibitin family protein [Nitrospirae bacterium]|nr:prohibitin family protein [Nitrospirota bacterium]
MPEKEPFNFNAQFGGARPDFSKVKALFKNLWVLGILLFVLILHPWAIVEPGHKGVLVRLGAVQPGVLNEGIHPRIPLTDTVVIMDVRIDKKDSDASAASKDLQMVRATIATNFHLDPATVDKVYQKIGLSYGSRLIDPAVQEVVKGVSARYTAEELITKRPEVKDLIKENLTVRLAPFNILVDDISITNFDFSGSFNDAIEAKQVAEQQVQKAQRDLQRIEVEAKQKIAQATAEAEALRLQKQVLSADLLRLREIENERVAIEKWNGKLPDVTSGAIPFINVK